MSDDDGELLDWVVRFGSKHGLLSGGGPAVAEARAPGSPSGAGGNDEAAFEKLRAEIGPLVKQAVKAAPELLGEIQKLLGKATALAAKGDFAGAIQCLNQIGARVGSAFGAGPGGAPEAAEEGKEEKEKKEEEAAISPTSKIKNPVGKGGKNDPADVMRVKELLGKFGYKLDETGEMDDKTIKAIEDFQKKYRGSSKPDGRIDPGKGTWNALLGIGRIQGDLDKLGKQYGVETAVLLAIQSVESGGNGFLSDGRPKILFEGHVLWRLLKKAGKDPAQLQAGNEDVLYPSQDRSKYKGGAAEYTRLEKAKKIDEILALQSASWGEFQIMGFNHQSAGYSDVKSMVESMKRPGGNHLSAVLGFCKANNLLQHVSGDKKDWAAFARGYNGKGYAKNQYDVKLKAAYERFKKIEAT